jgi:hypothetical protein
MSWGRQRAAAVRIFDLLEHGASITWRTKPTLIDRRTKNLRAVQLLLGHTKLDYVRRRTMSRRPTRHL